MRQFLILSITFILIHAQSALAQETLQVILLIDRPLPPETYMYRVLDLALKNQDLPYKLEIEIIDATQPRRAKIVNSSSKNYILAMGNQKESEELLLPVYIPIQLGLGLGHRIMLTRADMEDKLKKVKCLDDLKQFVFAQGLGWSDVKILRDAGLKVQTPADPTSIPKMMMFNRVDLYPRGLFEIDLEYKRYAQDHSDLIIDENLVISYPLVSFFYVRKGNVKLYHAIKNGLEKAYNTGQLQDLIMTDPIYSKTLQNIHLGQRVKIEIPVKNVSPNTLKALKKYPFIPSKKVGEAVRPDPIINDQPQLP